MDKLRALEYFVAAAEEHSFSAAARRLRVTPMAISKQIAVLESRLGLLLFERNSRGLALTDGGTRYLALCKPGLAQLMQADELLSASARELRGTIVVGVQHIVAVKYLVPSLPLFMRRYPEIAIDLRDFSEATEAQTHGIDAFLRVGWVRTEGLVLRRLAVERFVVCAAPAYWANHEMPKRPSDLIVHNCLVFRDPLGRAFDLWEFERGEERESVNVRGQLIAGNAHVFAAAELCLAGIGVCRIGTLASADLLTSGKLVPALRDWQSTFRPPFSLLYRPSAKRSPRVRLFINFIEERFRALEAARGSAVTTEPPPYWYHRAHDDKVSEGAAQLRALRVKRGKPA